MGSIQVVNVGKAYKHYPTSIDRLREWLSLSTQHQSKWVVKEVSFFIAPGEAVGIIGLNGAGKSTLLKMLTGVTPPTTGYIQTQGRVASMLELGMGFHPDFTGRENVYMAAQLLGYSHKEIIEHMPAVEDFAEIGDAIDRPLHTYSSGMQARLAFSIATAKRPDILIIDEALSVGDTYFQHKSFERIRRFQKEGTTLLFVSHSASQVQSICDRALLLHKGKLIQEGKPKAVLDYYTAMIADQTGNTIQQIESQCGNIQTISGTGEATVETIGLYNQQGEQINCTHIGEKVTLKVGVRAHHPIPRLILGYMIKDASGMHLFGTNTHLQEMPLHDLIQGELIEYHISFVVNLNVGSYSITTALTSTKTHLVNNYEWRERALVFHVINTSKINFLGTLHLQPNVHVCKNSNINANYDRVKLNYAQRLYTSY